MSENGNGVSSSGGVHEPNGQSSRGGDIGGVQIKGTQDAVAVHRMSQDARWCRWARANRELYEYIGRQALGLPGREGEPKPLPRHQGIMARILVQMESQNQADEFHQDGPAEQVLRIIRE